MNLEPLKKAHLPSPPKSIFKLLGPSFILIGLGLGTGELILWPYLTANWGLGIIWGALLGITMQFFLNMEIERYALVNGESVFVGFARLFKKIPYWFITSTLIAFTWPGFSAAAAKVLTPFGLTNSTPIAIGMLVLVGLILTLGPVLYKTVETFQKVLIFIGVPVIIFVVWKLSSLNDWESVGKGLIGIGDGYLFAPESLPFMSFLAAFAYSGAGGNLNLAQSFYIKEKGYGMGKYAGRITSLITGKSEEVKIEGTTFSKDPENTIRFNKWWRMINTEHALVFWGLGLATILFMSVLAHATVLNNPGNEEGINFIFHQAEVIKNRVGVVFSSAILLVTSLMLFSTQLSVIDASARIVSENIALLRRDKIKPGNVPKIYYTTVWSLLLFGILVLLIGFNEPRALIILGAVLNAFCMFIFSGILVKLNTKLLPKIAHPSIIRKVIVYATFAFFGVFSLLTIFSQLKIF